jgi:phage tail-like protein
MANPRDTANSLASRTNKVHNSTLFKVKFLGLTVEDGYFSQITGLSSQTDVLEYPEGGQNTFVHRLPTRIKQGNITLKRGVVGDKVLYEWYAKSVVQAQPVTLVISLLDYNGEAIRVWSFDRAYPVKWTGGDLNASSTEILTESLEVAHGGMTVTGAA